MLTDQFSGEDGPTILTMTTIAANIGDSWVLLSNFLNASFSGFNTKVTLFLHDTQSDVDLSPDGSLSQGIKRAFPDTTLVEKVVFKGNDHHNGALMCALVGWSLTIHKSARLDYAQHAHDELQFFRGLSTPPSQLFNYNPGYTAQEIVDVLGVTERETLKQDQKRRIMLTNGK